MKSHRASAQKPSTATGFRALLRAFFLNTGTTTPKITQATSAPARALNHTATLATIAAALLASAGLTAALPATASAEATIAPPPLYSSAPGLPDGRIYEQVSPADKNGNEAGAQAQEQGEGTPGRAHYGIAAADGNSAMFEGTGALGETPDAIDVNFVATKNKEAAGWSTRAVIPSPLQPVVELGGILPGPTYTLLSSDFSHAMFYGGSYGTYALDMSSECNGRQEYTSQIYLSGPDPFVPATWLERPEIKDPIESCEPNQESGTPVGGTPDFSTVYFTYPGTLLPEDESRAPQAHPNSNNKTEAWGFYEDREGSLREAGVLPNESLSPYGAVPAAGGHGSATVGNEVSADGSRAFFVSPDPASCTQNGGQNDCSVDPPELYVRENGDRTQLVSEDTLLPGVGGLPAPAPHGSSLMPNPVHQKVALPKEDDGAYVFASPDGSQAFFQSEDALTESAEAAAAGTEAKTYDFDVNTGVLTYLPDVVGQIVTTDTDGSSFAFVRPEAGGAPPELELWSAGPGGGSVTPVTQLSGPPLNALTVEKQRVSLARMSSDGSVLVFVSSYQVPGGFNSGADLEQIYRYDVPSNALGCVSCPPHGVTPTGDAVLSQRRENELAGEPGGAGIGKLTATVEPRGISSDGDRIFFDTPDPLVPQDTNTGSFTIGKSQRVVPQGRDVYEWENGVVYLISSGKSPHNAYFLDSSENGDDVFFATTESLVPGDTDNAYDVYDARVPQPGDNPPAAAVPCEGSVCQGPPNVPSPLTPPASATFSGLGNPTPEVTPPPAKKVTTKTVKCKKGFTKKKNKCVKKPKPKQAQKSTRGSK